MSAPAVDPFAWPTSPDAAVSTANKRALLSGAPLDAPLAPDSELYLDPHDCDGCESAESQRRQIEERARAKGKRWRSAEDPQALERLFDRPELRALAVFSAEGGSDQPGAPEAFLVGNSPYLTSLQVLRLRKWHLDLIGAVALVRSPSFGRLEALQVDYGALGSAGVQALLAVAGPLSRLQLRTNDIDGLDTMLERSRVTASLRVLDLRGNDLAERGVAALCSCEVFSSLEALDLSDNGRKLLLNAIFGNDASGDPPFGDGAATVLASHADRFPKLTALALRENEVGPAGLKALVAGGLLSHLTWLDLSNNVTGNDGARLLANAPHPLPIETLILNKCEVGDDGARALVRSSSLRRLRSLELTDQTLSPETVAELHVLAHARGLDLRIS